LSPTVTTLRLHASVAAWCGRGVLVRGASGAGKSALIADLLAAGAYLVADDLVQVERRCGCLYATPVAETGLIELRGNGIFRLATTVGVPVTLCVELAVGFESERLPTCATALVAGVELPRLRLDGSAPAVAQVLIALTARRAH
jgi:HPr kinase/phosphorylase